MLKDVLARIEQRLAVMNLKPATASRKAGLSEDAIRNMQRAVEKDASQGVSTNTIFALAPVLQTTPAWLLDGTGEAEARFVPIIGRVGADSSGEVIQADSHQGYDMAPVPPGGSANAAALEVIGDSMPWLAPDGALVYFERQNTPPTPEMVYYNVICELEDGRVLLKRLLRGSAPDLWTLESQIGPPIENVRIRWAAEPTAIIPPRQARIIIKRAGHSQVA